MSLPASAAQETVLQPRTTAKATSLKAGVTVEVSGLRNDRGVVRYCLAPAGTGFPECDESAGLHGTARISGGAARFSVPVLPPGDYAIAVFHDQNENGRMDKLLGIPREGYGFSNNPPFRARAPRFQEAAIAVNAPVSIGIEMRYIF